MTSQGQDLDSSPGGNSEGDFREKLQRIDSALGSQDVEGLKFLCVGLVSHRKLEASSSALHLFDHLLAAELLSEKDPFLLAELLYTIRQICLLSLIGYTKEQVEGLLPTQRRVSLFRHLLYELSESISSENLHHIKFLLRGKISNTKMTCLEILEFLEQQDEIDEDNLTLLEDTLKNTVPCLMRKIENYKREKAAQEATSPEARENESLPGEKEVFSGSDIQNLQTALLKIPQQNVHAGRKGDRTTNRVPASVSTKMSGASADPQSSGASTEGEDTYRMDRKHRGYCVIINNHKFTKQAERRGTHKDAECLTRVFQWLGFTVHKADNVTKSDMNELLQDFKSHPGHADADCFVLCILTHGILGAVYSSDDCLIPIQNIISHFTAQQCPGLVHKPKLFFIQACQGKEESAIFSEADIWLSKDVVPSLQDSNPVEVDFLVGLAMIPGSLSFWHAEKGSWYIQSLCNHLKNLVPRQEDILSILIAVNNYLSQCLDRHGTKKQMLHLALTLRKKLVFPVPQGTLEFN